MSTLNPLAEPFIPRHSETTIKDDVETLFKTVGIFDMDTNSYKVHHYNEINKAGFSDVWKDYRGVIKHEDKIICKTFNYTPEFFSNEKDKISDTLKSIGLSNCQFYDAEQITLLRLWYYNSKWHLSTVKKLDAFDSRWGSQISHGEYFQQAIKWEVDNGSLKNIVNYEDNQDILDVYYSLLPTNYVYTFLLKTNDKNRVVCDPPSKPQVYFGGEFSVDNWVLTDSNHTFIPRPQSHKFDNIDQILSFLDNVDPKQKQGLMIYYGVGTDKFGTMKLTNIKHQHLLNIRGNTPNLRTRYLEVRLDKEKVNQLAEMYPEHDFSVYENLFNSVMNDIYNGYLLRFVHRNKDGTRDFISIPQEQWFVCKHLHDLYIQDRKNSISLEMVRNHLNSLPIYRLDFLIKKQNERQPVV